MNSFHGYIFCLLIFSNFGFTISTDEDETIALESDTIVAANELSPSQIELINAIAEAFFEKQYNDMLKNCWNSSKGISSVKEIDSELREKNLSSLKETFCFDKLLSSSLSRNNFDEYIFEYGLDDWSIKHQSIMSRSYFNRPVQGLLLPDIIVGLISGTWGGLMSGMSCKNDDLSNGVCIAGLISAGVFVTYTGVRTICMIKGACERYLRKEWPHQLKDYIYDKAIDIANDRKGEIDQNFMKKLVELE